MKRLFLAFFCLLFCAEARQPNIIVIMADDAGRECFSPYGSVLKTPNLERFANTAIRFDNCESTPICTPSRVKIMTGQYTFHNYTNFGELDKQYKTFGNLLKGAGYSTGVFGKWQLGDSPNLIRHFGFDRHCLHKYHKGGSRFWQPVLTTDEKTQHFTGPDAYGPDIINDQLLQFIEENQKKPFFVYYPMVLAHWPFVPTPDSRDRKSEDWQQNFHDMVRYTDKLTGKVLDKLEELKIDDNTLVIFTCDNGTYPGFAEQMRDGSVVYGGKSMGSSLNHLA